jgi:eukaryotic-like serine/threonine-protein kinase
MPLWNEIEGRTLNGLPLRKLLRSEGRTAWFSSEDSAGHPAVLSLFEALNDEDAVEARLQAASGLQHPNLLQIRDIGRSRVDDEPFVYAVMEPFDQTLAEVLRDRTLAPEEAREVTESLLSSLEAVEAAGLSHGHVDASGVLGVGDNIKLRSDCLTPRHGERDALQLPAPFATLVRAGTGPNASLSAMRRVLNGPAVPNEAPAVASSPNVIASTEVPSAPVPAPAIPRREVRDEQDLQPKRRGITIAALVIMAIVLALFWRAIKRPAGHTPISGEAPSASSQPQTSAAATADVPPTAAPAGNAAGAMGAPETVKPAPAPAKATPGTAPQTGERSVWHVVVYTYAFQSAAQRKATELAARFPQFQPQVFSPTGHAPFLVALGSGTSRQEAFSRREAAIAAGLPKDTYMQNYRK